MTIPTLRVQLRAVIATATALLERGLDDGDRRQLLKLLADLELAERALGRSLEEVRSLALDPHDRTRLGELRGIEDLLGPSPPRGLRGGGTP